MICPWKFKGCWYVLESLKGVDLLESLPTSPIFVFLLWNWHFFEEFVVCSVPVFSFASISIFLPHNMYWMWARPGKFPICEVLENWWTAQTINGKNCPKQSIQPTNKTLKKIHTQHSGSIFQYLIAVSSLELSTRPSKLL